MPGHKLSTDLARFLSSIDRTSTPDECWPWTGYIPPNLHGYGVIGIGSRSAGTFKMQTAHRFALTYALGRPILPQMFACHTCDNPTCVRYEGTGWYAVNGILRRSYGHLFEGTTQDNTADRHAKGHSCPGNLNGAYLHPETISRGTHRYNARFTDDDIRVIRQRIATGERQSDVAKEYGVYRTTIFKIVHGESWKHITL